jgi:hypothetical protein
LGIPCCHAGCPQANYEPLLPLHHASRFGDVLLNTAEVVFETHRFFEPGASMKCPIDAESRLQTEFGNHFEVAPGPAAKVKYSETRLTLDASQHRCDVVADIVIACAWPELFGTPVIMFQCKGDYFFQVYSISYSFPS